MEHEVPLEHGTSVGGTLRSEATLIRIVCWNMQHKKAGWHYLCECHGEADLALLQEACTPPAEVAAKLDVGPGPWVHKGWKGARAVIRISDRIGVERMAVADIIESASSNSAIRTPARLAVAIATLRSGERIVLVSIESAGEASERAPQMIREIQQYCGADLPYIVGADLNTWWNSETTVFGDMMQIGLPLIGPHAATFYNPAPWTETMPRATPARLRVRIPGDCPSPHRSSP